ncbi:hypothetical protein E2C01_096645 [Portunus trituberculatus]|uniref:Uncharacterized protein n=1 Tax=Portunus trituberculatus TaxID=210409 RepID=A0A5B7JW68_PORTR|nr:hypothetical protein [Portunus trituberculatus]
MVLSYTKLKVKMRLSTEGVKDRLYSILTRKTASVEVGFYIANWKNLLR